MPTGDRDPLDVVAEFVAAIELRSEPVYVGIDPGGTGAIALLCGPRATVIDVPTVVMIVRRSRRVKEPVAGGPKTRTVRGSATGFNNPAIVALFKLLRAVKERVTVCLEIAQVQVQAKGRGTPLTAYKVGIAYGMWPLFLASKGYAVEEVTPAKWKKAMGLLGKDKEAARARALQLWPKADIVRKKDHNRAEALLLAEYARRQRGAAE